MEDVRTTEAGNVVKAIKECINRKKNNKIMEETCYTGLKMSNIYRLVVFTLKKNNSNYSIIG